jgi:amino-acid N-acetyltransferase
MDFVSHFRNSAHYIHAYRGKTSIIWLRSQVLDKDRLEATVADLTLLHSLGLKLVVLFDTTADSEQFSATQVIDETMLQQYTAQIGQQRYQMEALFSHGLINSPMHGAKIRVVSGNFVMARPAGVFDGTDLKYQGRVRRVDHIAIRDQLEQKALVLIPPIGYSITGETLYLPPEQLIVALAKQLSADKVIIVGENPLPLTNNQKEMSLSEAKALIENSTSEQPAYFELAVACEAGSAGIARCHVVDGRADGSILSELFTRDGVGILIAQDQYDTFRKARVDDVQGILALLKPLEQKQILVKRDPEKLEAEIEHYIVNERDGMIVGCAALYRLSDNQAELACVAVHEEYRSGGRGDALLHEIEKLARREQIYELFVLTTQTEHWFVERGFKQVGVNNLPENRQQLYNYQRNSKVYLKNV